MGSSEKGGELICGSVALRLGVVGGKTYIGEIVDQTEGVRLLRGDPQIPIWRLEAGSGDEAVSTDSSQYGARHSKTSAGLRIDWDEVSLAGASCRVSVLLENSKEDISASLSLFSQEPVRLSYVTFPIIGRTGSGTAYVPRGYGKAIPWERRETFSATYPSHGCTMQFIAIDLGRVSLYVGFHDPRACTKILEFRPEEGPVISCRFPVPDMSRPKTRFILPFKSVLASIRGDWYDVSRYYRRWAVLQSWSSRGSLSTAPRPVRLSKIVLWLQINGDPDEIVDAALRFQQFFQVPVGVHWYCWHQIPFDDGYPEYFPPKQGFQAAVRELSEAGIVIMPYTNARLWDPKTDSWHREGASSAATKDEEMRPYVETYGSKVPLTPMCPVTSLWRRKVRSVVTRLARCGVHGVYLDQIGAAPPRLCFDAGHGHPLGGGSWWIDGYRSLIDGVRRAAERIDPDFFLTTESNAEPWIDRIDALLMCNSTEGDLVPIFPAVYGDMTLMFGAYIFRRDLEDSWAFRTKVSQMFLWGVQLGWLGPEILEKRFSREARYLKELAHAYLRGQRFLRDGVMLRPPMVEGNVGEVRTHWELWGRSWSIRMPSALASCWMAPDGNIGVAVCNMADTDADLAISFGRRDFGWSDLSDREIRSGTLAEANPRVKNGKVLLEMKVEGRSAMFLSSER